MWDGMSDMPFWGGDQQDPAPHHEDDSYSQDPDVPDHHEADDADDERAGKDPRRPRESGVPKAKLVKAAQKALDLHGVDDIRRHRVAAIIGLSDPDIPALAVASVLVRATTLTRPVDDIEKIATEDPMAAVISAIAQAENRERFAAAWTVAACYTDKLGPKPPAVPTKAAFEFASAVTVFGEDVFADMRASLDLIRS